MNLWLRLKTTLIEMGAHYLAQMGVKYDEIIKHYYTGVELTKAY